MFKNVMDVLSFVLILTVISIMTHLIYSERLISVNGIVAICVMSGIYLFYRLVANGYMD